MTTVRSPQLQWKISPRDGVCTVQLSGELDRHSVDALESAMMKVLAEDALWVFDLERVTFVDSPGVDILRRWQERLHKLGMKVLLARPSEAVARVLHASALTTSFEHLEGELQEIGSTAQHSIARNDDVDL